MEKLKTLLLLDTLQKKLGFIADIHIANNHKLDENLIGEYDLSLSAVSECQAAVILLIEGLSE